MAAARGDDYIIENIDKAITELVHHKFRLQKAYNYYNGHRDPEQFRYLEENFGIGSPTAVSFTPLLRKHVDALLGEYLDVPTIAKISCKDSSTISNINRDKQLAIKKAVIETYKKHLNNAVLDFVNGKDTKDPFIEQQINKVKEDVDVNFISEYEIAAQNVLEYIQQSRETDLQNKKRLLELDLLVGGRAYYKVEPSPEKNNVKVTVLDPLNTFVDRNPSSQYARDGYRAVIRRWMTKEQIKAEYGNELTRDALSELDDVYRHYDVGEYAYIVAKPGDMFHAPMEGDLDNGNKVVPGFPTDALRSKRYQLIPVYEVEWIDVDKEAGQFVQNRYEGVRIGESIYIPTGKSENVIRTQSAPNHCKLSIGGLYMINRDNIPTSIVMQCMMLQDKYDVIMYLRDNILANSGTMGDWLDVSMLPKFLGTEFAERVQKWIAYKKSGVALIDSSQEGRGFNNNTFMSGFDDTTKVQAIQAFDLALQRIEEQVSSITGVFRERLNGITQRDAVSNIEAGAKNSFTITKPFYLQMDTLINDLLLDCLNISKIVWKNGLTGSIVLGDHLQKVFTSLPEYFTLSDHDVHIVSSTQILKDYQQMQQFVVELIKAGLLEPDIAAEAVTCKSMTELKIKLSKAWAKKKAENDQIGKLQQQLQEAQQQLEQLSKQNQQLQQKLEQVNESKLQLEQTKIANEKELGWYQAQTDRTYKEKKIEVDKDKVKIELGQLYDGNPYNDQIRFT